VCSRFFSSQSHLIPVATWMSLIMGPSIGLGFELVFVFCSCVWSCWGLRIWVIDVRSYILYYTLLLFSHLPIFYSFPYPSSLYLPVLYSPLLFIQQSLPIYLPLPIFLSQYFPFSSYLSYLLFLCPFGVVLGW
jgi:hypothetical protein